MGVEESVVFQCLSIGIGAGGLGGAGGGGGIQCISDGALIALPGDCSTLDLVDVLSSELRSGEDGGDGDEEVSGVDDCRRFRSEALGDEDKFGTLEGGGDI